MPSLDGLLIVVAAGFAAPFLLGLAPAVRIPAVVLEIVAGIVVGPSVLGWVEIDGTIEVLATIGLAFLLFLGGLEVDFRRLRGRLLRLTLRGYALSFALAVVVSLALGAAGWSRRRCSSPSRSARRRWACSSPCSRTPAGSTRRSGSS
jgi:Kef-type K+ transport system membrane component KefB